LSILINLFSGFDNFAEGDQASCLGAFCVNTAARRCERSEAIQQHWKVQKLVLDCFASLATTGFLLLRNSIRGKVDFRASQRRAVVFTQ